MDALELLIRFEITPDSVIKVFLVQRIFVDKIFIFRIFEGKKCLNE